MSDSLTEIVDWLNENSGAVEAVAILVLVAVTAWYAWSNASIARQAREQTRPYVILDFDNPRSIICEMVIKNVGDRPAVDVAVKFEPDPPYQGGDMRLSQLPLFKQMKFFAAGREFRFFYKTMAGPDAGPESADAEIIAKVSYADTAGKKYTHEIPLNPYLRWHLSQLEEKTMNDLVKAVEGASKRIEDTAKNISELGSSLRREARASTSRPHPASRDRDTLIAKLLEIRNFWSTLFHPGVKDGNIYHSPSDFQAKFSRYARELIALSDCWEPLPGEPHQGVNPKFMPDLCEELFDLSAMRMYADDGFQDRGDKVAEMISQSIND